MGRNKITEGTREWAEQNVNCYSGCSHDCLYCYAKFMAIRYNRKTEETWSIMEPTKTVQKGWKYHSDMRFMFPSTHDITPETVQTCLKVLLKLLNPGNRVLIVSKPHFEVIKLLCKKLAFCINRIEFRFTITSDNDQLLSYWEPNAPTFEERLAALRFAAQKGFKTSLSIEPFLDPDPVPLFTLLTKATEGEIWIGPMNYYNHNEIYAPPNLQRIYDQLIEYPQVRFKDAFINTMEGRRL